MAPQGRSPPAADGGRATGTAVTATHAAVLAGGLGGGLYALSLPKADQGWLAWLCLVPPLVAALRSGHGATPLPWKGRVAVGLAFGLVAGLGRIYWLAETLRLYGGLGWPLAWLTTALLAAYLALYPAAFFGLSRQLATGGALFPWLAASSWALLDWVQTWLISGFPWALLGYTQYRYPAVAQVAAYSGVHGLTFLIVLANSALASGLARAAPLARALPPVGIALAVAAMAGSLRLDRLRAEAPNASLRVGIVQANVSQDRKWSRAELAETTERYVELTRRLVREQGPQDLIVWPETALPYRLDADAHRPRLRQVTDLADELATPLLVGSLGSSSSIGRAGLYNRSYLVGRDGSIAGMADKVHLVPFGEYLPMRWLFGYLDQLTAESGAFDPGASHATLSPGAGPAAVLGIFICYESIFPSITRHLVGSGGASLLVNTTNDAWFGRTAAPYQHLAMAAMRAVETGRPLVRAANTGISGAVDATGIVRGATALETTALLALVVAPRSETTPYVRHGDAVVPMSALLLLAAAGASAARRQRRIRSELAGAGRDLEALARSPVPLARPVLLLPGYGSDAERWVALRGWLRRCFSNADDLAIPVDLRRDLSIAQLAEVVNEAAPSTPFDIVGHSLGAIVGLQLQQGSDRVHSVCALSPPWGGTVAASLARRAGLPFARTLADLSPGSAALCGLRGQTGPSGRWRSLSLAGDPVVGSAPPGMHKVYGVPLLLGPVQRHRAALADPRIIRDVVVSLRDGGLPS